MVFLALGSLSSTIIHQSARLSITMLGINPRRSNKRPVLALVAFFFILFVGGRLTPISNIHDGLEAGGRQEKERHNYFPQTRILKAQGGANEMKVFEAQLRTHVYRKDGLLEVNPYGEHPIFELVENNEEAWRKKLARASRTLDEAVVEYRRRYGRSPPRGFGDWWDYVVKHNVQLPDEYDQIYRDLEPFWGMDPKDLQKIQRDWEAHADSFTVGKDTFSDPISIKNFSLPGDDIDPNGLGKGAYEVVDLLQDVQYSIPPFHAVFSPHDNPNLATDHELMTQALEAAKQGTFINVNNPPPVKLDGWISACPPDAPARTQHINWEGEPPRLSRKARSKTFIHEHRKSMDPCLHPSHLLLHGQFISHRKGPVPHRTLIPQFSYGPTMLHHDITPAMPINWLDDIPRGSDPDWEDRYDTRLQWRGSNTGMWHADDTRWDLSHRTRLVQWAGDGSKEMLRSKTRTALSGNITVLMPVERGEKVGRGVQVRKALWTPAMVDVAFTERAVNCPPEMCDKLHRFFEFRKRQEQDTAGRYKYYIDVDGNGWSSRFKRLITSQALVFKSTIYPEWYLDRVSPWVHYIPIQNDLSDLWDAFVFFRGDPMGNGAHDDMAKKIAEAGREWSRTFWRKEDLTAYMFRLFLEYSRVMDPDRLLLSFEKSKLNRPRVRA